MIKLINFPSQIKNVSYAENLVDEISEKYDLSSEIYGNILVSLVEAVNNAVTHGNKLDPNKVVKIKCVLENDLLEFVVTDEGKGFDFERLPDPTLPENIEKPDGRGIFLMKHLSDGVSFSKNGSEVTLVFKIN